MKSLKILLLTLIFSIVSSCGFLNDEPVKDQEIFVSAELNSGCDLDPDKFGDILEINIEAQIRCLENNFIQFSRYVRSNDRTTISEGELSDFVRRFFKENTDTVIQGLKLIFELNMLLLRDEATSINRDNITPLFKLLVTVNKEAIVITKILRDMEKEKDGSKVFLKREELKASLNRFADTSLQIISKPGTLTKKVDLKKFLLDLNTRLNLGSDVIDEKLANAILFIKKLFFGGSKQILTSTEIEKAITKLPKLILMATDFALIKNYHFEEDTKHYDFQSDILKRFRHSIFTFEPEVEIFNIEDLYTLFDRITPTGDEDDDEDQFNIRDYEKIFNSLKKDLIGGDSKVFNYKEFNYLLNYIDISLDGLNVFAKHNAVTKKIDEKTLDEKLLLKKEFVSHIGVISNRIKQQLDEHGGIPKNADILNFTKTLTQEIDSIDFEVQFIDAIFGIKIALAGGKKNLLTNDEMYLVLDKLQNLASFYFDMSFINSSYETNSSKKWSFLTHALNQVFPLLVEDESVEALEINDVSIILEELFQVDESHTPIVTNGPKLTSEDIETFTQAIKDHVLTTTPESINVQEIKSALKLTQLGMSVLEFAKFFDEKSQLAKEDPDSIDLFTNEVEAKAKELEIIIERDLPNLVGINKELDYLVIAESISILFEGENELSETVNKISALKTIILGGKRSTITFSELLEASPKISSYAKSLFRLMNKDFSNDADNENYFSFLLNTFNDVKKNLIIDKSLEYFNATELLSAVDYLLNLNVEESERVNYTKFTPSVVSFKGRVIHQLKDPTLDPNDFSDIHEFKASHISEILEYIQGGLEVTYFNERTYIKFDTELQNRKPISWLNIAKIKRYPGIRRKNIPALRRDFLDSVSKYRHYTHKIEKLDADGTPVTRFVQYLGSEYRRTKFGHILTSVIKHVFRIVLEGYTIKQDELDVVDIPRINMLFTDFKPVLEEFGLWTSNFETFGENVILLSDLFQNTSNGDNALGLDEGVEFVTIVLIASSLTDEVMHEMKDFCENRGTQEAPAFDTSCYRGNLFEIWLNKLGYGEMFPKLNTYFETEDRESTIDYIHKTEGFARDTSDENIPMAKRDFTLLIGAMLNIESTFVRFDKNGDNVIDTDELDEAFLIYEVSIQKMADLKGWKKTLTKTVFYYMVKYMKIPSTGEVLKYHFQLHFNPLYTENIKAKRLNIGALLYNLLQYRQ
ncbi:hypothetical protein [Halobacteriovorax sp.]|uniref:hypothetical protein n=1 Tax=Halobacteriovorax sp. TaxID=2020862 RepID=UPI003569C2E5